MYRKTFAEIDGNKLKHNVEEIKMKYPTYKYYFGVVKNNAYHHGIKIIQDLIAGGINYLALASLEEALNARKYHQDIPILCLEPIGIEYVYDCINYNITITVDCFDYAKKLAEVEIAFSLNIHLKVDSGMNRLGIRSDKEMDKIIKILKTNKKLKIEGIYSHFATSGVADKNWDKQVAKFLEITKNINLAEIPIIHFGRSLTLVNHPKLSFCNGVRLGIILFGHAQSRNPDFSFKGRLRQIKNNYLRKKQNISPTFLQNDLNLKTAFSLYSEVINVHAVKKNEVVGYNATYKIKEDGYIAVIAIGYADGVTKSFAQVAINNKLYPIVAETMDMLMIYTQDNIKIGSSVEIFGNKISIGEVSKNTGLSAYKIYNQIQNRVPRVHVNDEMREEINY